MAEAPTIDLTTIKLRTSTLVELRNLKKTLRLKSVKDVITYLTNYFTDEPCERLQTDVQVQLAQLRQDVYDKLDNIQKLLREQAVPTVLNLTVEKLIENLSVGDVTSPTAKQDQHEQINQALQQVIRDVEAAG